MDVKKFWKNMRRQIHGSDCSATKKMLFQLQERKSAIKKESDAIIQVWMQMTGGNWII